MGGALAPPKLDAASSATARLRFGRARPSMVDRRGGVTACVFLIEVPRINLPPKANAAFRAGRGSAGHGRR